MTPKEKAEELFGKMLKFSFCTEYADERDLGLPKGTFTNEGEWECYCAKQCALIAVDEILSFIEDERDGFNWKKYYQQVKNEIEKL